jgi:nitroreductase
MELLKSRRSVRKFSSDPVDEGFMDRVLEAGAWAPSGLNNQPWAFAVVTGADKRGAISEQTHYAKVVNAAPALICVFLDNEKTYDRTKDCQAIGACVQNMLLYVHSEGMGAVWLGEILKNKDKVSEILGAPENLELMAVVAIGHPEEGPVHEGKRRPVSESVFYRG